MIRFHILRDWLVKELNVKKQLQIICLWYMLSLMVVSRKHSLEFASEVSGKNKSQFSRLLKDHPGTAILTLDDLSKRQARKYSKTLTTLHSLPWKVAIIIDLTAQRRSSLHPENVQRHNHGKGYFVGHQWTNIILVIGEHIIPLVPIAFHSRKYCKKKKVEYKSEHLRVKEYLQALDLSLYLDHYDPKDVVVLADSGYDDKRIENVILAKGWDFVMALKKKRSVKSNTEQLKTPRSKGWSQIESFFKAHRRIKWNTTRLPSGDKQKNKRKEFRTRHTIGWLKSVGQVQLVCSERKNPPRGERKYFACSNLVVETRQILIAYSLRWCMELFHKSVKMHLGFEHVSTVSFDSVIAHVHWVYCAYILLHSELPGVPPTARTLYERQHYVMDVLDHREKAGLLQKLTQFNGVEKIKNELKQALAA